MQLKSSHFGAMRTWVRTRRARGTEPNADSIWEHIRRTWPTLKDEDSETLFQGLGVVRAVKRRAL